MHGEVRLGRLLAGIESGWSPACDSVRPARDEWGVVKVSAVTSGRFEPEESKRLPTGLKPRPDIEIRSGDVLVVRANGARSLVGSVCQVAETRPNLMLSDKTLRLVPDENQAVSAFLPVLLRSAGVRRQIQNLLNGGTGQNNISQTDMRELNVPDIPLNEQHRIVAAHAAFERRIGTLERTLGKLRKAEAAAVVNALEKRCRVPLDTWLTRIEAGKSPLAEDIPAGDGEWGVLKVSAVQAGWFERSEN
jgi:type I restriction enzyme S subunit